MRTSGCKQLEAKCTIRNTRHQLEVTLDSNNPRFATILAHLVAPTARPVVPKWFEMAASFVTRIRAKFKAFSVKTASYISLTPPSSAMGRRNGVSTIHCGCSGL